MYNHKRDILGVKQTKHKRFFGNISLLLDNVRLRLIKNSIISNHFDRLDIAMKIKDDDIKIKALNIFEEEYEKIEIAKTIKEDDKKIKILNFFLNDAYKAEIITTFKDDNKKIEVLNKIKNKWYIGAIVQSIKGLENLHNLRGISELIETTASRVGKQEILRELEGQIKECERIKEIENDEERIEAIKKINSEYLRAEITKTIKNDDKKIATLDMIKDEEYKATVIETIKDDDKKIATLDMIKNEWNKAPIIETIKDDDKKIATLDMIKNEWYKATIIETIKDNDKKIKALDSINNETRKFRIIMRVKDKDKAIDIIVKTFSYTMLEQFIVTSETTDFEENENYKKAKEILKKIEKSIKIQDDDKKIETIDSLDNEKLKAEIAKTIKDDDKKISIIEAINDEKSKLELIQTIRDDNKKTTELEKLTPKQLKEYRNISQDIEFIKNNIEKFIELEGFQGDIPEDIIDDLYKKNNSVILSIDFRLLNEKYIKLLGKDKINLISCYPEVQEKCLSLKDKEICVFSKCIDSYMEAMQTDEWTVLAQELLEHISKGEYDTLLHSIQNLEELSSEDVKQLTQILQNNNWCNITDINQVDNFEKIATEKCNEIMQDKNTPIYTKKETVIQKIFGHDITYAESIINRFGEDIKNINDGDSKDYVESLKLIKEIEDIETLEEIFNQCDFIQTDKNIVERTLKNEYGKLFNEGLYKPKKEDLVDKKLNIYEAGTDFKIIMTSIGAYYNTEIKEYKEDWNRPALATQHFCASYIRNDMIGAAPINHICYGFSNMREDSLMLSSNCDVGSSVDTFISTANYEKYYTPEQQINKTERHNEMDFRRIQGGEKKQPDYILVFRKHGKIQNMKEAQMASKQWGGMPIVVIDVDKCLEVEKEKVEEMMQKYEQNPNPELEKQIKQKIRNNRVTNSGFCIDIDERLDYSEPTEEMETDEKKQLKVTEEELENNYKQISATERKEEVHKVRAVYNKIKEISRGKEHGR